MIDWRKEKSDRLAPLHAKINRLVEQHREVADWLAIEYTATDDPQRKREIQAKLDRLGAKLLEERRSVLAQIVDISLQYPADQPVHHGPPFMPSAPKLH